MLLTAILAGLTTLTQAAGQTLPEAYAVTRADVFDALDLERPGLQAVKKAVDAGDLDAAAEAWAQYMRRRQAPTLHFSREKWAEAIRADMPQLVPAILEAADKVGGNEVGHGPYKMPIVDGALQWHSNPTKDTNYVSVVGSQWLLNPLGRAYLLTGDEKYAEAFAWFFGSWFDHREEIEEKQGGLGFAPIYHAYYPGIRVRVLLDNYYCLLQWPGLTADLQMKLMREIIGAARWVYRRNGSFHVGNQQVAAALAPGLTGLFFPELKESEAWADQASTRMAEHLSRDFFADGGHKELCTQYHKTVLRDVAFLGLTQKRNGQPSLFDGESGKLLERAYDWLAALVMPSGTTPPLHSAVFATDWVIHLTIGARFMSRPDFWAMARPEWEKGLAPTQKGPLALSWALVTEDLTPAHFATTTTTPDLGSVHLKESGFAVMRTGWEPDDRYLVFQYGWANSGHAYPGALSFLLAMNDEVIATQPGSPRSYRHAAYGYCHSTRSHNVVSIDNASYTPKGKFAPGGVLEHLADLDGAWYVRAHHDGYKPLFGAVHERHILAIKDGPVFWFDRVEGGEGHTARRHFHTPLDARVADDKSVTLSGKGTYRLLPADPERITDVEVEQRWEAVLPRDCQPDDCGKVVPALAWVQPLTQKETAFGMALVVGPEGSFRSVGSRAFELRAGGDTYLVSFGPGQFGEVSTDARCACVRLQGNVPMEAWVLEGTTLTIAQEPWLDAPNATDAHLVGAP